MPFAFCQAHWLGQAQVQASTGMSRIQLHLSGRRHSLTFSPSVLPHHAASRFNCLCKSRAWSSFMLLEILSEQNSVRDAAAWLASCSRLLIAGPPPRGAAMGGVWGGRRSERPSLPPFTQSSAAPPRIPFSTGQPCSPRAVDATALFLNVSTHQSSNGQGECWPENALQGLLGESRAARRSLRSPSPWPGGGLFTKVE